MPAIFLASIFAATLAPDAVSADDRSGPSRQVKCRLDNGRPEACRFTPLFGDGSFNIELSEGRELRIVVDGKRGWLFVPLSPDRRSALGSFHRDEQDRACWVADIPLSMTRPPDRICAYN